MPGSLYPRSPSLEPESHPTSRSRHVRFQSGIGSPKPNRKFSDTDPSSESTSSTLPFRPPLVPSVKDAVSRFRVGDNDADPSILLPKTSPTRSPITRKAKPQYEEVFDSDEDEEEEDVGDYPPRISAAAKGKQRASMDLVDGDTSGHIRVRGKEQELFTAREQLRRNEERFDDRPEVDNNERERDKEKIKMLEEEVKRLREEVCWTGCFVIFF